jgi:hypothetical protein
MNLSKEALSALADERLMELAATGETLPFEILARASRRNYCATATTPMRRCRRHSCAYGDRGSLTGRARHFVRTCTQ